MSVELSDAHGIQDNSDNSPRLSRRMLGNSSSSRFADNPKLNKINNVLTWTVGFILLIVVIIYASVRGKSAYHHMSNSQTNLIASSKVNFPAVTLCPLESTPLLMVPKECLYESSQVESTSCLPWVKGQSFNFEGVYYNCFTFNDPPNPANILASTSLNDELVIQLYVNKTLIVEELGALCMIHDQGVIPELETHSAFLVDVGKVTDIWMRKDVLTEINGVVEVDWSATISTLTLIEPLPEIPSTLIDLDFAMEEQGYYQVKEYYVYTTNNWIGEVGGLACLLMFLHQSFCFIVMTIVAYYYNKI